MLEQMKYINHVNEAIEFGKNGIFVNHNELHNYSWDFTSNNNRILGFNRGIVQKTVPIVICCDSETEGASARNRLMEITEKDVLALQHGKIVVGDYYLKCYITESKKEDYLTDKGYMKATLAVATDFWQWVKESTVSFRTDGSVVDDEPEDADRKRNLDYNYDPAVDYLSDTNVKMLNNTGFVAVDFRLTAYGSATNPAIYIGGHAYQVDCMIADGEYLTIDSKERTVFLTRKDGERVNRFNCRNRESYIFEKIPAGENAVAWDKSFGFDVTLLEERSEPKWT